MKISKQAQRDARQMFRICVVNGVLDETRASQCVKLLSDKKPRGYVEILSRLHRLVKLDVAKRTAKVESASVTGSRHDSHSIPRRSALPNPT